MQTRSSGTLAIVLGAAWLVACSPSSTQIADNPDTHADGGAGGSAEAGSDAHEDGSPTDGDAADLDGGADAGDGDAEPFEAGFCSTAQDHDTDGDGIPDSVEGRGPTPQSSVDTDGDQVPDYLDDDSDGDTIPDAFEGDTKDVGCYSPLDSDGDGKPDFQDTDSDNNGIEDRKEIHLDKSPYSPSNPPTNSGGAAQPDYCDIDNDGDALLDTVELTPAEPIYSGCAQQFPPDTDCDGTPDVDDPDSDEDGIRDDMDGPSDFDGDGHPNFRDDDSDDDGIPDECEAGPNHQLNQLPRDSDHDGKYDFVDLDSDGDGIPDNFEDANQNCKVDKGETNPALADTDGDGVNDLVESTLVPAPPNCASTPNCVPCARNPNCTPESNGKFYFLMPYQQLAQPRSRVLPVATSLQRADVAFVVDTTGSMGHAVSALQTSIADIVTKLKDAIPDLHAAVAAHDDFPVAPYSVSTDLPFYLPQSGAYLSKDATAIQQSITSLIAHGGSDVPENQVAALWRALTNKPLYWPGGVLPTDFQTPTGTYGALGFRPDALPILVSVTDAPFHNGRRATSPGVGGSIHDPYAFTGLPEAPQTIDDLVAEMVAKGARFVGLALDDGSRGTSTPYGDMAYIADQTLSTVPPDAFGGGAPYKCRTGLSGNPLAAPDGANGSCRLVFDLSSTAPDIGTVMLSGVTALAQSLTLDIRVMAIPDASPPAAVDAVDSFMSSVQVEIHPAGFKDPTDPTVPCIDVSENAADATHAEDNWTGAKGITPGSDALHLWDTVTAVRPPTKICFRVVPQDNVVVPQTTQAQVFHAVLQVRAKNGQNPVEIDFGAPRDVLFVVPPLPQ